MGHPVSVRLDEGVQTALESAARDRGIGLSTYLRDLAAQEADRLRRERIRAQSRAVAAHIETSEEARAFQRDWTRPSPEDGDGGS